MPFVKEPDIDSVIGEGLEPRMCFGTLNLCAQLRDAFGEPEDVPIFQEGSITNRDDTFMKLLYSNAAAYLKALLRCSETQMLDGAEPLRMLCLTMVNAQKQYTFKGKTTKPLRMSRKVYLAKLITEVGLLPALAAAAKHMAGILQKHLQPEQRQQQAVLELSGDLVQLFATTATWWPGSKLFNSKPFETTWPAIASVSAAILQTIKAAAAAATAAGGMKQLASSEMSKAALTAAEEVSMCADVCAGAIIEGFGFGDFAGFQRDLYTSEAVNPTSQLTPKHLTPAIQQFLLSDDLLQLLELGLGIAALARYTRLSGCSSVPEPPGLSSDSFASSSSSSGSRGGLIIQLLQQQQQQKLRVASYHDSLLEEFGIEEPGELEYVLHAWHKDWEPDAIKSLYLVTTYQQQQQQQSSGSSSSSSSSDSWQWKVDRLNPQGYNCWHHLAETRTQKHHMKTVCLLQAMIELIALDPDGQTQTVWMLLQLANQYLCKLEVLPDDLKHQSTVDLGSDCDEEYSDTDEEDAVWEITKEQQRRQRRLPVAVANCLLHPVLQQLGPVVLYVLREKASREQLEGNRGVMFFAAQLLTVLIGQSELHPLSVNFYRSPVASASIIEASLRAIAAGQLDPKQHRQQQQQGQGQGAAAATGQPDPKKQQPLEGQAAAAGAAAAASTPAEAAKLQGQAFRVVLALSMGLNGKCSGDNDVCKTKAKPSKLSAAEAEDDERVRKFWYVTAQEAVAAITAAGNSDLQLMIQQHLVSLLITCSKLGVATVAVAAAAAAGKPVGWTAVQLSQVVNQAVAMIPLACQLGDLFLQQQQQQQQHRKTANRTGSSKKTSSSSSSKLQQQQQLDPVQSGFGPWAVIVSRNLLLLISAVRQAEVSFGDKAAKDEGPTDPAAAGAVPDDEDSDDPFSIPLYGPTKYDYFESVPRFKQVLQTCAAAVAWLHKQLEGHAYAAEAPAGSSTESATAAVTSAKYIPQEAHKRLAELADAAAAAIAGATAAAELDHDPDIRIAGLLDELPPHLSPAMWEVMLLKLEQFATAVHDQLPLSCCCNNPICFNLDKLSEQQLVAGKGSICGACGVARYCSRDCQKQHWKQHKTACKRLQYLHGPTRALRP